MTQTLIIAAREIRERTLVLMVAAFSAVVPFIVLNLPGSRRTGGMEMIGAVGTVGAVSFTIAMAFILGASILGRELTERRLSFYFARPVNASAIWFGKLLAAIVLLGCSFAIIFVPSMLAGRSTWERALNVGPGRVVVFTAVVTFTLFLISHALSTAVRSRSGFAGLDLAGVVIAGAAAWVILTSLLHALAVQLAKAVSLTLLAGLIVSLIGAGAWQLSRGRADSRRSHLEMSKFFWTALAVVLVVVGVYTAWVFAADVDDLREDVDGIQSSSGQWAAIGGTSPFRSDFYSMFLVDLAHGTSIRFPSARFSGPSFTRNGDAAFSEAARSGFRGRSMNDVVVHRFGRDQEPVHTGITDGGNVVVSDDLNRLAVVGHKTVAIHEIDSKRLVASAALPAQATSRYTRAFFVTPDVLRIVSSRRENEGRGPSIFHVTIMELNAATRKLTETGTWSTTAVSLSFRASGDGSILLANRFGDVDGPRTLLLDGRTAAVRAVLDAPSGGYWAMRILADGRIAVVSSGPERTLRLFAPDGSPLRDIPIGSAERIRVGNETQDGHLIVSLYLKQTWEGSTGQGWETLVVDLNGGRVTRRDRDIVPAYAWWPTDPRAGAPNASGEILVTDASGEVLRWNPTNGAKKKLI